MSKESLEMADEIIMEAFKEGLSTKNGGNNLVIRHRLRLFGDWINGNYYLNERGFDYAMNGCRKGIEESKLNEKRIESLEIKIKSFSARWQWLSLVLSILAFFISLYSVFKD